MGSSDKVDWGALAYRLQIGTIRELVGQGRLDASALERLFRPLVTEADEAGDPAVLVLLTEALQELIAAIPPATVAEVGGARS